MEDVAKMAGVSKATVSRYINRSGYVGAETKKRIEEAIKKLNYTPNEVVRSLFQKKSRFIGLLLPDITNPFFMMLARGVEDRLNESDYGLILANVENDRYKEQSYINSFKSNHVAGIISVIERKTDTLNGLPCVSIDRPSRNEKYCVVSDDYEGGRMAAAEIVKRSPEEILVINSAEHLQKAKNKLAGIEAVLFRYPYKYYVHHIPTFRIEEIDGLLDTILERYPRVDSIIASNDLQALVILNDAIAKGIRVLEDLQVIGYDNIFFSNLSTPALSTIAQPIYEMGEIGAEFLLKIINGEPIEKEKIMLPVEFIERGSLRKVIK